MIQNNLNHISDDSKYVTYDSTGTSFPAEVVNVKQALDNIAPWALLQVGLPIASETTQGIARISTEQEVEDGLDDTTIVTPKKLQLRLNRPQATETVLGVVKLATNEESAAFTDADKAVTPLKLGYVFDNVTANTSRYGTVKLSSSEQGQNGTDDTTATTPKIVMEMISRIPNPPAYNPASETEFGIVRIATTGQIAAGVINEGYSVSPFGFINTRASDTQVGTTRFATILEMNSADSTVAVTPDVLYKTKADSFGRFGITSLSDVRGTGLKAIADNAGVLKTQKINGIQYGLGDITLTAANLNAWNRQESDARYLSRNERVGTVTRQAAAFGWGPWDSADMLHTPNVPGKSTTVSVNLTVKFNRNNDSSTNRYFTYQVFVGGNYVAQRSINVYNSKGGSSGHSWRFETYAVDMFNFTTNFKDSVITIVPVANYLGMAWGATVIATSSE